MFCGFNCNEKVFEIFKYGVEILKLFIFVLVENLVYGYLNSLIVLIYEKKN